MFCLLYPSLLSEPMATLRLIALSSAMRMLRGYSMASFGLKATRLRGAGFGDFGRDDTLEEVMAGSKEIGAEVTVGSAAGEGRRWRKVGGGVPTKAVSRLLISKAVIGKRIKNSDPFEGPT